MDIIGRAVKLVDRLVIGVARNDDKGPLFTTDERLKLLSFTGSPGVGWDLLRWLGRDGRTSSTRRSGTST